MCFLLLLNLFPFLLFVLLSFLFVHWITLSLLLLSRFSGIRQRVWCTFRLPRRWRIFHKHLGLLKVCVKTAFSIHYPARGGSSKYRTESACMAWIVSQQLLSVVRWLSSYSLVTKRHYDDVTMRYSPWFDFQARGCITVFIYMYSSPSTFLCRLLIVIFVWDSSNLDSNYALSCTPGRLD